MNIICFGDSITQGSGFARSDRWPESLQAKLDVREPGCFRVYSRGVGGDTSARAFDRLETDVLPLLPGLLLVQFGFNDANVRDWSTVTRVSVEEFKKNLREFCHLARTHGGDCVFIVNHSIGCVPGKQGNGRSYNENLEPYEPAIRATATACAARLIDLPAVMVQRRVQLDTFLGDDRLHLSAAGSHLYADMVFTALTQMLSELRADASKAHMRIS
jgi:lysophospholipase L1-like esterase